MSNKRWNNRRIQETSTNQWNMNLRFLIIHEKVLSLFKDLKKEDEEDRWLVWRTENLKPDIADNLRNMQICIDFICQEKSKCRYWGSEGISIGVSKYYQGRSIFFKDSFQDWWGGALSGSEYRLEHYFERWKEVPGFEASKDHLMPSRLLLLRLVRIMLRWKLVLSNDFLDHGNIL